MNGSDFIGAELLCECFCFCEGGGGFVVVGECGVFEGSEVGLCGGLFIGGCVAVDEGFGFGVEVDVDSWLEGLFCGFDRDDAVDAEVSPGGVAERLWFDLESCDDDGGACLCESVGFEGSLCGFGCSGLEVLDADEAALVGCVADGLEVLFDHVRFRDEGV